MVPGAGIEPALTPEYHRPSKDIIEEIEKMVPDIKDEKGVFYILGEYWFVRFDGKPTLLQNQENLDYIKELLSQPKKKMHVEDLTTAVKGFSVLGKEQAETAKWYSEMSPEHLPEAMKLGAAWDGFCNTYVDLDQIFQTYVHVLDEIKSTSRRDAWYGNFLACHVPAQCVYLPIKKSGVVSEEIYQRKEVIQ